MIDSNQLSRPDVEIKVDQLEAYLKSKRWHADGMIRNAATIWHRVDNEDSEILVPSVSARDYLPRIMQALSNLAAHERREISDIIKDIRRTLSNVITVRVVHNDTSDGTIPINDGVMLIAKARELLSATAQSVYNKRKTFTGAAPKEAKEYLDTLLLGQTEVGSYIVNVIAPEPQYQDSNSQIAKTVSLGQVITRSLITSLEALELASATFEEMGDLKAFDEAVRFGASSNMCDALLGFSGEQHCREFEITVAGASVPLFESEPRKFTFTNHQVKLLERVSDYYKEDYVLAQRRLIGYITKLSRPRDETSGTIVIDSSLDGTERKIRVDLTGDDYHLAVIAHDNSKLVRVDGDVHIKRRSAQLLNATNFGVIENEDLF